MSKGYRDGAFALGLVIGAGVVVNLFLWLDYTSRNVINTYPPENQNSQNESETALWWWRWTGDYVSSSDTLAQWIMAFFTIAATGVLVLTLRSANKTNAAAVIAATAANRTNELMRKEARPWVVYEVKPECRFFGGQGEGFILTYERRIINRGINPAFFVYEESTIFRYDPKSKTDEYDAFKQFIDRHKARFDNRASSIRTTVFPHDDQSFKKVEEWSNSMGDGNRFLFFTLVAYALDDDSLEPIRFDARAYEIRDNNVEPREFDSSHILMEATDMRKVN